LEDQESVSKKTLYLKVNRVCQELIDSNELTRILKPQNYSGILLIDGKYVPVKKVEGKEPGLIPRSKKRRGKTKKGLVVIPFLDYGTHDIPVFITAFSENSYEIEQGFQMLKTIGYPLKAIVCDESMGQVAQVAKKVFPDVVVQLCLTHYTRAFERTFKVNGPRRSLAALERKLAYLGESFFYSSRHYDQKRAVRLTNRIAALESEYGYLLEIQEIFSNIFWKAKTIEEVEQLEDMLNVTIASMRLQDYPHRKKIIDRYQDYYKKRDQVLAWLLHPELRLPYTTNLIEGFNSTALEIRFSSVRGFEKEENARHYINALILKRRFQRFKDCKEGFKFLNGKAPLQVAQPLEDSIRFPARQWIRLCRKFKRNTPSVVIPGEQGWQDLDKQKES